MADITEIIEESAVQLEIVELGGGQIEVIDNSFTIIEIVETSITSDNLDISPQTNTVVVETPSDNVIVDISVDDSTTIETTITNNVIDIIEPSLTIISQSVNISNFLGGVGDGRDVEGSLTVSDTLFTDVVSASIAQFSGDGNSNILIISSGSNTPITVNPSGLIVFDQFMYTPPPVEGGFLYSGSEFFIGLVDS